MRLLWTLGAGTAALMLAFAMINPVLAVLLQRQGHGPAFIGAFAMLPFLLVGLLMPFMPRVLARIGPVAGYRAGAVLELAAMAAFAGSTELGVWIAASVVSGIGAAVQWNAAEALLTRHAPAAVRGRVMGLYQTGLGASLALGPFLPALLGLSASGALWLATAFTALCLALALVARAPADAEGPHGAGDRAHGPRLLAWLAVLAFAGGVFEAGLSSIGAAHAASLGMALGQAASVAGAIGIGSFLVQYPAGWAGDHVAPRRLFTGAAVVLLGASALFSLAGQAPWLLWACGFAWGAVGGALYTLSMVQVAHAFAGQGTAAATAAIITGYTWGGTLGPLASGVALESAGVRGMATWLALLALAAWAAARRLPGTVQATGRA